MRLAIPALLVCLLASPATADTGEAPEKPTLRLVPGEWTAQVGDSIILYLVLEVPEADAVFGNDEAVTVNNRSIRASESINGPALTMSFYFRPKEAGFTELGPYSITLGDQTLTSEMREIQVFPNWERGEVGYRWQLSHELVKVGQPFGLTVRQRTIGSNTSSRYLQIAQLYRSSDAPFQISGSTSSSSSGTVEDERDRTLNQSFTITPKKIGELHITREVFEDLPDDVEVPELIVDVVEQMPE